VQYARAGGGSVALGAGVVAHVATEEMLHLALVQNLLSAIGSAQHLARPTCPHQRGIVPPTSA
jgi:hypothetical protein